MLRIILVLLTLGTIYSILYLGALLLVWMIEWVKGWNYKSLDGNVVYDLHNDWKLNESNVPNLLFVHRNAVYMAIEEMQEHTEREGVLTVVEFYKMFEYYGANTQHMTHANMRKNYGWTCYMMEMLEWEWDKEKGCYQIIMPEVVNLDDTNYSVKGEAI